MQCAFALLSPVACRFYYIFPRHDVIKMKIKFLFRFYIQILSETFLILKRNEPDMLKYAHRSSREVPVILVTF